MPFKKWVRKTKLKTGVTQVQLKKAWINVEQAADQLLACGSVGRRRQHDDPARAVRGREKQRDLVMSRVEGHAGGGAVAERLPHVHVDEVAGRGIWAIDRAERAAKRGLGLRNQVAAGVDRRGAERDREHAEHARQESPSMIFGGGHR
jgi:hypothetical protein